MRSLWAALFILGTFTGSVGAVDFERDIRPIFKAHCISCHGPEKQKGELRLDSKTRATAGGSSGPIWKAGKSGDSELVRRVGSDRSSVRMPPTGKGLSVEQIALIRRWIDDGARWDETAEDRAADRDRRNDHWAWQPIQPVAVPKPGESILVNPIDAFIARKLESHRLQFSQSADRRTLIRRLSFDLHGLPPSPEAVLEFEQSTDPLAYEKLVDSLLASPRYGERWARHWLDIAHYADTHGFERDQRRDHAYRYRDWVIRALNRDMPYDRFLADQIAGDALRPDDPDAVTATAFLSAGPWDFVGQAETPSPTLKRLARADDLDDMVTQVMTAACGVTINCARCHDHKLDPITQREYYRLWAVFAGVKRADRVLSPGEGKRIADRRAAIEAELRQLRAQSNRLRGSGWSLADAVGGGDGTGTGKPNAGIDPVTGRPQVAPRGFLDNPALNRNVRTENPIVDSVFIPDGGETGEIAVTTAKLAVKNIPKTSGKAWDAVRNGPVHSQFSTKLGDIDFARDHSLLGLHANAGITFDLNEWRRRGLPVETRFRSTVGYFGQTPRNGASVLVLLDGELKFEKKSIGRDDGLFEIDLIIPGKVRFLTLIALDGGNGISHDQIGFGDPRLESTAPPKKPTDPAELEAVSRTIRERTTELAALGEPAKVYGIVTENPPEIKLLSRGNPEDPRDAVTPGTIACVKGLSADLGPAAMPEGQRRIALAKWITDPANPLTRRVIANRLWQYHFGVGLLDTPSDLGLGGSVPTHPELLDWLADRILADGWSLKAMHRLICLSRTYRQASMPRDNPAARMVDGGNRLLWRQHPRRLEAESLRDAILTVSGKLQPTMFGAGYRDFEYKEEYAPVYTYVTADRPDLWRRSIYRFVVRTTPQQFLTTLDCPNPANLAPVRSITTTALQSLMLLNDGFVLKQANYTAERIRREAGDDPARQAERAFRLIFGRGPTPEEATSAVRLIDRHGLGQLCRFMFNANEFVSID